MKRDAEINLIESCWQKNVKTRFNAKKTANHFIDANDFTYENLIGFSINQFKIY